MRTARTILEAGPPRPGEHKERDATVLARVVALKRMPVNDLKAEWKALFGTEAPNNSRSFLELRLAHRIQELTTQGTPSFLTPPSGLGISTRLTGCGW